jgi:hypothetical protein
MVMCHLEFFERGRLSASIFILGLSVVCGTRAMADVGAQDCRPGAEGCRCGENDICDDGLICELSTDEPFLEKSSPDSSGRMISEFNNVCVPESDDTNKVILISILVIYFTGTVYLRIMQKRRFMKAQRRLLDSHVTELLGASVTELQANPERMRALKDRVKDKFTRIGIVSYSYESSNNGSDNQTHIRYESFLIDIDGSITNLEIGNDDVAIEDNARWLAEQLEIPFEWT